MNTNSQKIINFLRSNPEGKKTFNPLDLTPLCLSDKELVHALEELEDNNLIEYHSEWIVPTIKLI